METLKHQKRTNWKLSETQANVKKVDDRKTKAYTTWNQKYEKTWEIQKEIQKR